MTALLNSPHYYIGTCGWSYPQWLNTFYPAQLPRKSWLSFYAEHFNCLEINATFYRNFSEKTYQQWYDSVPANFRFILKAPRLLTHQRSLTLLPDTINEFWNSANYLQEKLAHVLLQLAPSTPYNPELLSKVINAFHEPQKVIVEFRHSRWLTTEVKNILQSLNCTFCIADSPLHLLKKWLTSPTAYIRLHGHENWYKDNYDAKQLHYIAQQIKKRQHKVNNIFVLFNNTNQQQTPENVLALKALLV